ncbi:hypothetical protein F441_01595 [Phytophthora nicotianae CJ01A1]|uniref:Cytochrome P450 n=6 Tax=Phytophthora nicotianae TaxID=4792 RepID=W2QRC3_PHYN3|nr:hypothetical protein PPTG_06767 [Phytophthora nicotianae INRA-310]ETI55736.1 hypothetical protein F443_01633 [Phytophthora nicotianae P1569]ETK95537.1 hypothetical protein L915_01548 [Phytophthora nicotianae]ETO84466.1 hypothetical protein F444_01634 [Phytophthora nicotianae P1976]ETP25547.1 hypothetical protein F441_01595 [Phytophthora nicotianae CJ01A1]ETP53545.1 hypothetical protein F442_01571 [Phytophthora nicotianae P10297]KUF87329.1 Cytochrome P450 86A2 [Phytophthora nicotianae]
MDSPLQVDSNLPVNIGTLACVLVLISAFVMLGFSTKSASKNASSSLYLPSRIPIFGNTLSFAMNVGRYHEWVTGHSLERDGQPFALNLVGKSDVVYVSRPEHFEEILKTQNKNFIKSDSVRDTFDDFLGENIVLLNGEQWKFHRKVMVNLLTPRALREYITPVVQEKVLVLRNVLNEASRAKQTFDMNKLIRQFTLDTFVEIGLGCKLNLLTSGEEHPFEIAFDEANHLTSKRFSTPTWIWKPMRWLNIGSERRLRDAIGEMNEFIVNLIMDAMEQVSSLKESATENHRTCKNIITILLNNDQDIAPTLVRDIVLTGLEAGRNTTADTLVWLFHALSLNPRVEKKLRDEILTKMPKFKESDTYVPTYEEIQDLPYMEATIQETFRLFPSVPVIPYHCACDTVLKDGTFIPAGVDVFLYLYGAGRLASVWGLHVLSFMPERFLDEETGKLLQDPPAKNWAFGTGPRLCVGRNLAMVELKMVIATVVSQFTLAEEPGQDVQPIVDLTLTMKNPLMMRVEAAN